MTTRLDAARAEAKTADRRYASGTPLSPVDGMPIGIKDVIQTRDMPTKFGSPIFDNKIPDINQKAPRIILDF